MASHLLNEVLVAAAVLLRDPFGDKMAVLEECELANCMWRRQPAIEVQQQFAALAFEPVLI